MMMTIIIIIIDLTNYSYMVQMYKKRKEFTLSIIFNFCT